MPVGGVAPLAGPATSVAETPRLTAHGAGIDRSGSGAYMLPVRDPVIYTILCATDFSLCAEDALHYALFFARTFGAHLHLVHVDDTPSLELPGAAGVDENRRSAAVARLEALARRYADRGVEITTELLHGPPYETIVAHAAVIDADLIVLGTHGRTGLERVLVGSVAERVVRLSPVPVVTVRHGSHPTPPRGGGLPIE